MNLYHPGKQGQEQAEKKQAEDEEDEEEEDEERRKAADENFVAVMKMDGKFEEIMAGLDDLEDATCRRLLGWAAFEAKPPGVCT